MTLPAAPPRYDPPRDAYLPIKLGEKGWRAWALQNNLLAEGYKLPQFGADGQYGQETKDALQRFQTKVGLKPDAVCGPATQMKMLKRAEAVVAGALPELPPRLLFGFLMAEGSALLAPTNWSVGGGVDCGPAQYRVYGPPYDKTKLKLAFDARESFRMAAQQFLARQLAARTRNRQRSLGLTADQLLKASILAHNAPFMYDQITLNGRLTTPRTLAQWTNKPGGGHYTHAEWAVEYPRRILEHAANA